MERRLTKPVIDHLATILRGGPQLPPAGDRMPPAQLGTMGQYRLLSEIGRGSFGTVYRAFDTSLRREVALKVLTEFGSGEAEARFVREARTAAQLDHPSIATVYEIGKHGDLSYICMRLVDGGTLDAAAPKLGRERRLEIVRDVALALQYAHDHGVVHRDVKPRNILVAEDGAAFVVDFGLAREIAPASRVTETGAVLGTLAYLSPEQARGHAGDVDTRSDIYSLGVVLYELVTGRHPFQLTTAYDLVRAAVETAPEAPRAIDASIGRDLQAVILKAMEKEKRLRYARASELAADLDAVVRDEPVSARRGGLVRGLRRHRRAIGLGLGAVLLAAGAYAVARATGRTERPPAQGSPAVDRFVEGERLLLEVTVCRQKGYMKGALAAAAKAEAIYRGAIDASDTRAAAWLGLARCQGVRGAHRDAVATLTALRRRAEAVLDDKTLVREARERLLVLVTETLPVEGRFDTRRLGEVEGLDGLLACLDAQEGPGTDSKDVSRRRTLRTVMRLVVEGDREGARAAAVELDALENGQEPGERLAVPLQALLASSAAALPRSGWVPGVDARLILYLAFAAMHAHEGHLDLARKQAQAAMDLEETPAARQVLGR